MNGMLVTTMRVSALMRKHLNGLDGADDLMIDVVNELTWAIAENSLDEIFEAYRQLGGTLEFDEFQRASRDLQEMVTGETDAEYATFYAGTYAVEELAQSIELEAVL